MKLKVLTSGKKLVEQEVSSVHLTTLGGEIEILPEHASTVVAIKPGLLRYDASELTIKGGIARVHHDEILILAD